jgi:hypothetical protein
MDKEKLQGKITDESVMRMSLDIDPSFAASEHFDPRDARNSLIEWLQNEDDNERLAYSNY